MERHVSQSDFGLVLTYDNRILPKESWCLSCSGEAALSK
jgi:hypothetical protein